MGNILEFNHISYRYPEAASSALVDITLSIEKGSFVAVVGANGCGKSTLAKHCNAILLPTEGKVFAAGMDTSDPDNLLSIRRTVGMVFQNPDNQIVANVVEDDVAFAPENLGLDPAEIRARVDNCLQAVGMSDFRMHAPHLLSGGQKQRVAIAGVLAMKPEVLILDEATAMLDPQGRQEIVNTIEKLCREEGITIVYITHHMDEAAIADRILVMDKGSIVLDGSPSFIFQQEDLLHNLKLDVPDTIALELALKKAGWDIPVDITDPESCVNAIAEALCQ